MLAPTLECVAFMPQNVELIREPCVAFSHINISGLLAITFRAEITLEEGLCFAITMHECFIFVSSKKD